MRTSHEVAKGKPTQVWNINFFKKSKYKPTWVWHLEGNIDPIQLSTIYKINEHRQPLCTNQVLLEYQLLRKSIDVIQVGMQQGRVT